MSLPSHPFSRFLYVGSTSLLSSIAAVILSIYQATINFEIHDEEHMLLTEAREKNYVIAVWHSFINAALFSFFSKRLLVYSDHPRLQAYEQSLAHFLREISLRTLHSFGYDILDASLGKQSAGILNFVKKVRQGHPALIAPDGPNGPIYEAKPGAAYIAAKGSAVIIPVGFGFTRRIIGKNWDDFSLPLPFSKVVLIIGEPIEPPAQKDEKSTIEISKKLEESLDQLTFRAGEIAANMMGDALNEA